MVNGGRALENTSAAPAGPLGPHEGGTVGRRADGPEAAVRSSGSANPSAGTDTANLSSLTMKPEATVRSEEEIGRPTDPPFLLPGSRLRGCAVGELLQRPR